MMKSDAEKIRITKITELDFSNEIVISFSNGTMLKLNWPHGHEFDPEYDVEFSTGEGYKFYVKKEPEE